MSEINDNSSESIESDILLQQSRLIVSDTIGSVMSAGLGARNTSMRTGVLRPSLLGPSRLGTALSNNSTTFSTSTTCDNAKEDKVDVNPFLKEQDNNDEGDKTETADLPATEKNKNKDENCSDNNDDLTDPMSMLRKNGFERANLFAAAKSSIPLVEKSGFVFGQNVHERVVGENVKPENSSNTESDENNGTNSSQLLFSSVIQNAATKATGENIDISSKDNTETKSLTDVAREYEESRARKRTFEEVETFTGEENEVNILDLNCKLFAFIKSNWEERGRGSLRLNDPKNEKECSRLVFRTSGNLRVLLNTKVWGEMDAAQPSPKSLRLTAMDNTGKIKIFLVMARPTEISQLFNALKERIEKRKLLPPEESGTDGNGISISTEINKNGVTKNEVEEAATAAEPDHDDSNEPSPKKNPNKCNEDLASIDNSNDDDDDE